MTALSPTRPETETPVQAPTRSIDDVLFAVHVMDEDIALGVRQAGSRCPIRRAAFRQLVLAGYRPLLLTVGHTHAAVTTDRETYRFEHSGSRFVSLYDDYQPVEPCVVNFTRRSDR